MVDLNLNEKIISKKFVFSLQSKGTLYITSERLIFEPQQESNNITYISLSEIQNYKHLKIFNKIINGFEFELNNGMKYSFGFLFGHDSFLLKLEEVKGNSIQKSVEVKHSWLMNFLFSILISLFIIYPTFLFLPDFVENFSSVETKKSSCDLKYNRNKSQYELLFDHVKKHPFCETYTVYTDHEDDYGNITWKPYSRVTDLSKEEYDEIRKYQYYSKRVPMSGFKFNVIKKK
jgi:hypothetical protein